MKRALPVLAGLGLAAAAGVIVVSLGGGDRAQASTFHVNFDQGQDQRDGLSPATAWKHAPGDPNATGAPARTRLQAGDTVMFAANVRYRGAIQVRQSGAPGKPITYRGATPKLAVIDGSDPVNSAPCRSAEQCGGAANWRSLFRIDVSTGADESLAIFDVAGPLRPSQEPDPSDDFYTDEPDDMLPADGQVMSSGQVVLPPDIAAGMSSGGGSLALWVKPNRVVHLPIARLEGATAFFAPDKLQYYTNRPSRAGAVNHVSLIDQPGEYAILTGGRVVVAMPRPGSVGFAAGGGRGGFELRKATHIVIRDLSFENMSDGGRQAPGGVAIFADKGAAGDLTIENNVFRNFVMPMGQGPIILREIKGLKVIGNVIETIVSGSGMRLTGTDFVIKDNELQRLGRTGIMLLGASNVEVSNNRIKDIRGVHGNGVSVYLGNKDVRIVENTITDAKQPATFHGDRGKGVQDNNILFANNLFVATPDALGALISWGASTRGVTIRNNVLLGGKTGLRLSGGDTGVSVYNNIASGLIITNSEPVGWNIAGNEWTQLTFQQHRETPKPQVSFSQAKILESIRLGQAPADVCAVIAQRSPATSAGSESAALGASLKC